METVLRWFFLLVAIISIIGFFIAVEKYPDNFEKFTKEQKLEEEAHIKKTKKKVTKTFVDFYKETTSMKDKEIEALIIKHQKDKYLEKIPEYVERCRVYDKSRNITIIGILVCLVTSIVGFVCIETIGFKRKRS